jgi:hypothetical protein
MNMPMTHGGEGETPWSLWPSTRRLPAPCVLNGCAGTGEWRRSWLATAVLAAIWLRGVGAGVDFSDHRQPGTQMPEHSVFADQGRMRTGTRCTILVKLPVAFSGGKHAELRTGGGCEAVETTVEYPDLKAHRLRMLTRWPGLHVLELVFFEIGIDPQAAGRHHRQQLRASGGIRADPRTAVADDPIDRRAQLGVTDVQPRHDHVRRGLVGARRGLVVFASSITASWRCAASSSKPARLALIGLGSLVGGVGALRSFPPTRHWWSPA